MPSKDAKLIIEHIVSRFLNPKMDYKPESFEAISDILDLPMYALRNVNKEDSAVYEQLFHIRTIRDMTKLDPEHPLNILLPAQKDMDIEKHLANCEAIIADAKAKIQDLDKLRTSILISNMISNAWEKRADYLNKKDTKVITVGLDNAGKTAILSMLGGKLGFDTLKNLKPTKRIERRKISTDTLDLFIWDFGGQQDYRTQYLQTPEKFFLRTDLMIYVIDMQDAQRFQMSFNYFSEVLGIMARLSESPYILCFLHKADPDIMNDPDFQISLEFVKEKVKEIIKQHPFEYDVYVTSIYNMFTSQPRFSKYIKDVLKDQQSLTDPMLEKVSGMADILNTTLNAVITLSGSLGEQIAQIITRLDRLETDYFQAKADGAIAVLPKSPKERQAQANNQIYIPASQLVNPIIQQIQSRAIESSRNLEKMDIKSTAYGQPNLSPPPKPGVVQTLEIQKKETTRFEILKDLQGLFQKAKTLKK